MSLTFSLFYGLPLPPRAKFPSDLGELQKWSLTFRGEQLLQVLHNTSYATSAWRQSKRQKETRKVEDTNLESNLSENLLVIVIPL
jgi:hypothetical protein